MTYYWCRFSSGYQILKSYENKKIKNNISHINYKNVIRMRNRKNILWLIAPIHVKNLNCSKIINVIKITVKIN